MGSENNTPIDKEAPVSSLIDKKKKDNSLVKKSLLALLIIGLVGGGIYQYQLNKRLQRVLVHQEKLFAQMQQTDIQVIGDAQQVETTLSARINDLDKKLQPLAAFYQTMQNNELARLLSDTEQTLTLASEALYLTNDVNATLKLLRYADNKIYSARFPELVKLHSALQKDINTLTLLPQADIATETARIDTLLERVASLPLHIDVQRTLIDKKQNKPTKEETSWWKGLGRDIWQQLKSLVQIQRIDKPGAVLLSVDQLMLLQENIRLRLLSAKIALMTRNSSTYLADLKAIQQYLSTFFDQQQISTQQVLAIVQQLLKAPLGMDKPILTSLEVLRGIHGLMVDNRGGKE